MGLFTDSIVGFFDLCWNDVHYVDSQFVTSPESILARLLVSGLDFASASVASHVNRLIVEHRVVERANHGDAPPNQDGAARETRSRSPPRNGDRSHSGPAQTGHQLVWQFGDDKEPTQVVHGFHREILAMSQGYLLLTTFNVRIDAPEEHRYWSSFPPWTREFLRAHFSERHVGEYQIQKCIARSGSYGAIVRAKHATTGHVVAVKLEADYDTSPMLEHEKNIYDTLLTDGSADDHVPRVYEFGSQGDFTFLALELLGPSLSSELDSGPFDLARVLQIATMAIRSLEFIHSKGIIHRDVKPSNLCYGLARRAGDVFLIDFGLAKRYRRTDGQRIPFSEHRDFVGTARFASRAPRFGIEQCPWDDLESLVYTLLTLLRRNPDDEPMAMHSSEALFDGLPNELQNFLDVCRGTTDLGEKSHFESRFQRPVDYAALHRLLEAALEKAQSDRTSKKQKTNTSPKSIDETP